MPTIYEMKENLSQLGSLLTTVSEEIRSKVGDPGVNIEELRGLKDKQKHYKERFDLLNDEIGQLEDEQRDKLQKQNPVGYATDEQRMVAAKADYLRSLWDKKAPAAETRALIGLPGNDVSGGNKLLPTTMSNTLIAEPYAKNPMRAVSRIMRATKLELPKITFNFADDSFITDKDTAKEMEAKGDTVSFSPNKVKVFVDVSETVLRGTDTDLVAHIENALQSGLATKEKKVMFAATPAIGEEKMSFYSTPNAVKTVNGGDMFEAITNALADLHEDYRENAKVTMRYADYVKMIKTLANGSATLYSVQPEQIIGAPVIFCDYATKPIVGDFNYSVINYDLETLFEQDKNVKSGIESFVLTAYLDHRLLLSSAFRIAEVKVTP
ncbi:phage major capsid protein [Bacillus wiedmannii]|uniref:phage major capsid protein n=1 Tax=Bacillus wiedmannii TaxID=1890302 RepID=UPI0025A26889|nr:phage major capsid protein [Bacillus wiedmannii]MDM5270536.1 phage major capsid protein [Bacillus wiedmannii]